MAVQATFIADFSSFNRAVEAAEVKLKSFTSGAANVEKALKRVTDSFSGRQILQEAALAVKAVEGLGGATKLTEAEQKRLNATLTEAIAKYKALGQTAPTAMTDLHAATSGAEKATGGFTATVTGLGKSILTTAAGFFTAQAAFAAVRGAVRLLGDELHTLTLNGAAVADVTENFDHLTEQSGRLGAALIGELRTGTHGTIADFDLMKVATQDLAAGLNLTDQQFGTLAKGAFALAQATGGDVATALDTMNEAMLTGRTRTLALLTGKIDLEQAEQKYARSLGTTRDHLSDEGKLEAARAAILDSVGGAIERLGVQTDGLDERVAQARAAWANFQNELGRTIATSPVIMAGLDGIAQALSDAFGTDKSGLIKAIAAAIDDAAIAVIGFAKAAVSTAGFIVTEWLAVKKIYGDVRQVIDGVALATLYLGKAQLALPNAIGIGTDAWKKNDAAIQDLLVSMKARGAALQADDKAQKNISASTGTYLAQLDKIDAAMRSAKANTTAHAAAVTASIPAVRAVGNAIKETGDKSRTAADDVMLLSESLRHFNTGGAALIDANRIPLPTAKDLLPSGEDFTRYLAGISPNITSGMHDIAAKSGVTFKDGIASTLADVPHLITRALTGGGGMGGAMKALGVQLAEDLTAPLVQKFAGLFGGGGGGGTSGAGGKRGLFEGIGAGSIAGGVATLGISIGAQLLANWASGIGKADKNEIGGRSVAADFTRDLENILSQTQKLEVATHVAAGANSAWAITAVAVKDAYIKAGKSGEEALAAVDKLWKAEKIGGKAVEQVIAEITLAVGGDFTQAMVTAGDVGVEAFDEMAAAAKEAEMAATAAAAATLAAWSNIQQLRGVQLSGGEGTSEGRNESDILSGLSSDEARRVYTSHIAPGSTDQDWQRVKPQYGFATGTHGKYVNFGTGTPVMLHGKEKVTPQGADEGWSSVSGQLAAIERLLKAQPRMWRDAMLTAGY